MRVIVAANSRKTRGCITSVIKANEMGEKWKQCPTNHSLTWA